VTTCAVGSLPPISGLLLDMETFCRAAIAKDGPPSLEDAGSSLYDMFQLSVKKYGDNKCLGARTGKNGEYEWMTYSEVNEKVSLIGSAMAAVGLEAHGRVGVYGPNSPEWMMAMQACNRMNLYCIPLYDTLGENAIEYIVKHSEASVLFAHGDKLDMLCKALPDLEVHTVIYWGKGKDELIDEVKKIGPAVYSFDEFLAHGKANPCDARPPSPEDLCTIMYTSGTTGDPKGVELTHAAVMATVASLSLFLKTYGGEFDLQEEVFISYLPLAHIFDRATEELVIYQGGAIGYWRGDIKGLVDDIGALKPTLFAGVPRVFDRIYAGVLEKIEAGSFLKKALFNWGFSRKLHALDAGHKFDEAAPFFDKLVFSKVKERLGGRVRLIVSGGAPLARHVEDFLRVCMCCRVVQGYGLTETCAASAICIPDTPSQVGTVGPPQPCISVRLEAVPEMECDPMAKPPKGELCIKGPSVFTGYYKEDKKTEDVLDADGWFHTGDVAEITPEGAIKIVDRKKSIFKLAQGEYVAVEKVEGCYKKDHFVEQIWVYGNSFKSFLVAIVIPKETKVEEWAKHHHKKGTYSELCNEPQLKQAIQESLNATAKDAKLKGFEVVKKIHIDSQLFSVENDLLTPTFKSKRPQLQKKYQKVIDQMYD
jgi:long-chain acyl-CoA synthetase